MQVLAYAVHSYAQRIEANAEPFGQLFAVANLSLFLKSVILQDKFAVFRRQLLKAAFETLIIFFARRVRQWERLDGPLLYVLSKDVARDAVKIWYRVADITAIHLPRFADDAVDRLVGKAFRFGAAATGEYFMSLRRISSYFSPT